MVAIREQWVGLCPSGPNAGVNGIWWLRTGTSVYVGMSKVSLRPIQSGGTIDQGSGSAAQRKALYLTNATAALTTQLGPGYVVTVLLPDDGTTLDVDSIEIRNP